MPVTLDASHRVSTPRFSIVTVVLLLLSLLPLAACSTIPISYYDGTTYTQLTSLKAESMMLVESFDTKPVAANQAAIDATLLNFRKAYEYEKGKGDANSDTLRQFEAIQSLFKADVQDYLESGPGALGRVYFTEAARVLGQAFDIAIATENLKNRDKR